MYLRSVSMSAIDFHVTVALDYGSAAADPIRELLQAFDTLLPQVPRWAEPVLPVLSNLASISEAPFTLKAFEQRDIFASLGGLGLKAGSFYAQDWTRQLMLFLGSSDMIGNPLGFYCVTDARKEMIKSVERSVEDRDALLLGRGVWDGVAGTCGGLAAWVARLLNSGHRCLFTFGCEPLGLQLVASSVPAGSSTVPSAAARCSSSPSPTPAATSSPTRAARRRAARSSAWQKQVGVSAVQLAASPVVGAIGAASIILKGVDKGVDMRTRPRHARGAPRAAGAEVWRPAAAHAAVRVDGRPRAALLRDSLWPRRPRPRPPVVRGAHPARAALRLGGAPAPAASSHAAAPLAARAFWHEVVSLTPDALSDLVELRLFHRPSQRWLVTRRWARARCASQTSGSSALPKEGGSSHDDERMAAGNEPREIRSSKIGTRRSPPSGRAFVASSSSGSPRHRHPDRRRE